MAQRIRNVPMLSCLILILPALAFIACTKAAPTATPEPTPTPTPSFEEKRAGVLRYVLAFNNINNDLNAVFSQVQFPKSTDSSEERLAFSRAIASILAAIDGALARHAEVQPSALDPDTSAHKESARAYLLKLRQTLVDLQQAFSTGDSTRLAQQLTNLTLLEEEASSINRKTEQLMLKYNISDDQANYRFRGL